jgi:hypothetical protein
MFGPRPATAQSTGHDDAPTVAQARDILAKRVTRQSEGGIWLVDFRSPSGAERAPGDNDGERRYLVTYQAEVEFREPCVWDTQFENTPVSFKTFRRGAIEPQKNRVFDVSRPGERYMIQGQLMIKGSGTGWEPTNFTWSDPPQQVAVGSSSSPGTGKSFPDFSAQYASSVLENGMLKVRYYLPDRHDGYYRGTRFDWSGLVFRVEYAGHRFLSEFRHEHDPLNHDDICGTAEEFGINAPPGYAESAVGDLFLKVGIGLLERPDTNEYSFSRRYPIAQEGAWTIRSETNRVEFRQECHGTNGWAYNYVKTLKLDSRVPVLTIRRVLKNTGTRDINTDHYGHNFLEIDDLPAGPDYVIEFPFQPRFGAGSRPNGCIGTHDRSIVFLKEVPDEESVWVRVEGFSNTGDNSIRVRHRRAGATMEIRTDQPATRMAFYSHGGVLSPEPFVEVRLPPGFTKEWRTTYTFGAGSDGGSITDPSGKDR